MIPEEFASRHYRARESQFFDEYHEPDEEMTEGMANVVYEREPYVNYSSRDFDRLDNRHDRRFGNGEAIARIDRILGQLHVASKNHRKLLEQRMAEEEKLLRRPNFSSLGIYRHNNSRGSKGKKSFFSWRKEAIGIDEYSKSTTHRPTQNHHRLEPRNNFSSGIKLADRECIEMSESEIFRESNERTFDRGCSSSFRWDNNIDETKLLVPSEIGESSPCSVKRTLPRRQCARNCRTDD